MPDSQDKPDCRFLNRNFFRFAGLIIFGVILWQLDVKYILEQFKRMQIEIFLIAVVLLILFHILKAFRWQYILGLHGISYNFITSYLIYLSGIFTGILTPGRIGDFAKIFYLKADGYSTIRAVFSSILDRLLDIFFLIICGLLSLFWIIKGLPVKIHFTWVIAFILVGTIFISKLLGLKGIRKISYKLFPQKYVSMFEAGIDELKFDLKNYSLLTAFTLTTYTLIGWILYFVAIYIMTISIDLSIPFFYVVAFFVISTLISFVPITVAGVGTRDLALLAMFTQIGYVKEEAISFSILILICYILTTFFGLIAWLLKPIKI